MVRIFIFLGRLFMKNPSHLYTMFCYKGFTNYLWSRIKKKSAYKFWYFQGSAISISTTTNVTLDAPMEKINLHMREGGILPLQQPNTTTYVSRQGGFELRAAICSKTGTAEGSLYWDDGDTIGKTREKRWLPHHSSLSILCLQKYKFLTTLLMSNT